MLESARDKVRAVVERHRAIEHEMADTRVASDADALRRLGKEYSELQAIVDLSARYEHAEKELRETRSLLSGEADEELAALAREEAARLEAEMAGLAEELQVALLPKDVTAGANAIVEIRAGAGGDEAGLFAMELLRMYQRYAENRRWSVSLVDVNDTGVGGIKEAVFEVRGAGAYNRLKHESGVHRVQRVPETESQGRIHTSTATVAVLPEPDEVTVEIKPEDIRVDIYHAGGHGGQNVNKVATAVRLTHLETGLVVTSQKERSQLQNRSHAMDVLRARLWDLQLREQQEAIGADRRAQVGTGDRSEKIRTYNFPQNRVTDHRVNLTSHNLQRVLEGDLDEFIDALLREEQALKLAAVQSVA